MESNMVSIELSELAVNLRFKYKLDAEVKTKEKYPLTVFRNRNASTIKIQCNEVLHTFNIQIIKPHDANVDNLSQYIEYEKNLTKNEVILRVLKILGL